MVHYKRLCGQEEGNENPKRSERERHNPFRDNTVIMLKMKQISGKNIKPFAFNFTDYIKLRRFYLVYSSFS